MMHRIPESGITSWRSCLLISNPWRGLAGSMECIGGFHRLLARRFPHAIYYRIIEDAPVVFRVLDCRRSAERIRRSLEDDP
jgi:hypothetical protein